MHHAATCGFVSIVKKLLEFGADVEVEDAHGRSPLFAVYNEQYHSPAMFSGAGAVDDTPERHEELARLRRIDECREEIVTTLLDAGADLESEMNKHEDMMSRLMIDCKRASSRFAAL